MPLIGDELRTILGMMPVRDRAGIARGTMADDAARAEAAVEQSNGNAEGPALTMQGMRPPQIQLPPMGGPGAADVALPDDVATEYASGRKKAPAGVPYGHTPLPIPAERVVTSSPAAAPSAAVATRASDVMLASMQQRERQAKMMQLIGSIGLIANAFNRNPQSQSSTRESLSNMLAGGSGGGGGNALNEIKTLADMRAAEDKSILDAKIRENTITQSMQAEGWTRPYAEMQYDTGNTAKRYEPDQLLKRQGIVEKEQRRRTLEPLIPELAKARGTSEIVLKSMLDENPDAFAKLAEAEGLTKLAGEKEEVVKKTTDNVRELAELQAWKAQLDRMSAGGATPEQIAEYARSPAAAKAGFTKSAERAAGLDDTAREKLFTHHIEKERPEGVAAAAYLETARQVGDVWSPNLTAGTFSGLRREIARAYATATGQPTPDLNDTAKMDSLLKAGVAETMRVLGGNDTDRDIIFGEKIKGATTLAPEELRGVAVLNEKAARVKLQKVNAQRAAYENTNKDMKSKFSNLPPIEMPPPSKLLLADIYHPEPQYQERNAQLRSRLEAYRQQYDANPSPTTEKQYRDVAHRFDREYGAGTAEYYINQPKVP